MAFLLILNSCTKEDDGNIITPPEETSDYFPPLDADEWASTTPDELNWNTAELENLLAGAGSSEKKETPPKKVKKIKMNIKKPEKKKPEMPKALAKEWNDLAELGTGDIYDIIFENEVEDLARRKEPKTEKQQSRILDQAVCQNIPETGQ